MNKALGVLLVEGGSAGVGGAPEAARERQGSGLSVHSVSTLSEARVKLRTGRYDAILLDLELPDSRGLDTLRAILRAAPHVPVVVLVEPGDEVAGQRAIQAGAHDTVAKGASGEPMLPRVLGLAVERARAADAVRKSEHFAQAVLDGLSDHIAILDRHGIILSVNRAWREFAAANQGDPALVCEGADYLGVCDAATGEFSEGASEMAAAIRAMIAGERASFAQEYPCHSPDQERWFAARVTLFPGGGPHRVVVVHESITERKRAEEQLRRSERLYRAVVEDQTELICRFQADGTLVFVNEVYCRVFGEKAEELIGQKWQPLVFPEDVPRIEAQLSTLSRANPVAVIENRVYSGTGEVLWMQFVNRAFFDREDRLAQIQAVGRDITERRRVEEELHRRRAELEAVYDHAPVMLCLLDENRRVVFANRSFTSYAGLAPAGCFFQVACGVLGCANALDDPRGCGHGPRCETCALRRAIMDTLESGRSHHNVEHTTTLSDKGGQREVIWLASTALVPSAHGPRVLLCLQDITTYRQAERELRASEARLRALYENSLVGILFTAPDGRVFHANPAACRILGRSEEEIRRLGRFGLLDPRDPNLAPLLAQRARAGTVQGTVTYLRGDGTRFPADTASVIFNTPEGPRTCTIIQDVTEREAAAKRIREFSRRLLSVREEEKRRLSVVLHHDLGSMSVGVGARLQAAEEDLLAGKVREAVEALREGRRMFEEAVQRLKTLALELRPPDLDILGLPVALRQHFAHFTRITPLRISFTDATRGAAIDPEIETALFRVAQECLTNIGKHAEAHRVRVRIATGRQGVQLSIADDGVGFDPAAALADGGRGMGLAALRELVRSLGGELTVESAPGKGTRVRALFPVGGA